MNGIAQFKDGDLWIPIKEDSIPKHVSTGHPEWFDKFHYPDPDTGYGHGLVSVVPVMNLTAYVKHVTADPVFSLLKMAMDAEALTCHRPYFSHDGPLTTSPRSDARS